MKTGRSLQELAIELDRQNREKKDFIVPTQSLEVVIPGAQHNDGYIEGFNTVALEPKKVSPIISMNGIENSFKISSHSHGQIATHLGIPKRHYDTMLNEHPDLLAVTVNTLFRRNPSPRMIRTLDSGMRAFLSNRYRPIDNFEVAQMALEIMADSHSELVSCEVTDTKMYLKALFPRVEGEITKGDVVQMGVVISNSEIGMGRFSVQPLIYRLVCSNGMIGQDGSVKKAHLGMRTETDGDGMALEYAKNDTLMAMDKALMLQVRDTMRALSSPDKINMFIDKFRDAANHVIEGDPVKAVEVLQKKALLGDDDRGGILRHLIIGGDMSKWGLANAVTRYSQDVESYDKATSLESLGGQIIELNKDDWRAIARA